MKITFLSLRECAQFHLWLRFRTTRKIDPNNLENELTLTIKKKISEGSETAHQQLVFGVPVEFDLKLYFLKLIIKNIE
ncbi:hypothetical protein QR98_0008520 [Sarcoptes scabiei]|uniref:Uncharacterized protein n=1 Tax=Sarcoptes scabiei TaxID=52283 RepID=A0A131ZUH4_SARSC|nr:hypothetical protein QR98_0008520 [Sarcoptes scabiei]